MITDYKAMIFDWDGTLVDTCGLVLDAHNHVRKHMGHALWTMDDFLGQASKSAREYYPEIYAERSDEAQRVLYEYVGEHHLKYLKPMAYVSELLNNLQSKKVPMSIVSNKRHDILLKEVETMGWEHYFEVVIGAGYADKDKPAPDPLLLAISQMNENYQPLDILYVGDTETDLLCAQNTKCPVAFIQADKLRPDLIEKYKPDSSWESLRCFAQAIEGRTLETAINKAC